MANPRTPNSDLVEWTNRKLKDIGEAGVVTRIQIWHGVEGDAAEYLETIQVKSDSDPDDIAQQIWEVGMRDAKTRLAGRTQRYVAVAYRGDDDEEQHAGRQAFLLAGQTTPDLAGSDTEPSTPAGLQGQLMRHNERKDAIILQLTELTTGHASRELDRERLRRQQIEDRLDKYADALRDLDERKHERALELAAEERKNQRHEQMMGMLLTMMPLIASKVLGPAAGAMMPSLPAAGARDEAIRQFLSTLEESEIMGIMGVLKPDKQLTLIELYKTYQQEDVDRKAQAEKKSASKELS